MSYNASEYNCTNKSHLEIAEKLIKLIKSYEKQRELDIIIDVGSGSGNVTHLMASSLKHKRVFGLDIDQNMYDFANESKSLNSIEYLLCDLSVEWNSMEQIVKQLEKKVSLVFSNMAIPMIKNKSIFVSNIKKLLENERRAYFSYPIFPNFLSKLSTKEKMFFETFVKIPDFEKQLNVWSNLFISEGFEIESKNVNEFIFKYKSKELISHLPFMKFGIDFYCKSTKYSELSNTIQQQLLSLLYDEFTNWKDDQIDWTNLDELMKNGSEFLWKIVFLVVKLP